MNNLTTNKDVTRRRFLAASAFAGTAPMFLPESAKGANERLNVGVIGVGGRGAADLAAMGGENVVALCDTDKSRLSGSGQRHPNADHYTDYRRLIDRNDIDAVVIATPDHQHAPATVRALRSGKHVYCEKPLTHTVEEARVITQITKQMKLATQMGTQNHEHPGYLRLVELLETKAVGQISEVHIITDRPGKWWPQGMDKPAQPEAIPEHIEWDTWLGPAKERPYHSSYLPFKWRGWWDFGCGAVGDMAIHLMDPTYWGLKLGGNVKVHSHGPEPSPYSAPKWMITKFSFGKRDDFAPVDVYWYEGEAKVPEGISESLPMNGSLFIGEHGKIACAHGQHPIVTLNDPKADFKAPEAYLPESPGHHAQWIQACKTGSRTGSNFEYAGPFTEIVLLGNIAYRVGDEIEFNPKRFKITNNDKANGMLSKEYRKGWEI